MKSIYFIAVGMFISIQLFCQGEFETYKNGLIYSEITMNKLERIVDSLNLKYKNCDLNKIFYSKNQAIANIVTLDSTNILEAKNDLDNNISFDDFVLKYPLAKVKKNVLVVKYKYKDYDNQNMVEFDEVNLNSNYGYELAKEDKDDIYNKKVKNSWLYNYNEKNEYSNASIIAYYFPSEFISTKIPEKYAREIGYSDCLIDTVTTKFKNKTKEGWVDLPKNWQKLTQHKKEKLLNEMRSIEVVGGCSQDSRPREHAIHIALLSAETTNWEVFLKSHLDIMNDRFDRVSDGSYAWAERKTYIKELEELDINVTDLLMGIAMRVENPATNHYFGSIGRLGRAITESNNRSDFEGCMLSMIEDAELDDYNRVLSYFLFISYNNYLESKIEQKANLEKLKLSIAKLPVYLKENLILEE